MKPNYIAAGAGVAALASLAFALATGTSPVAASDSQLAADQSCNRPASVKDASRPNITRADYRPGVSSDALVSVDADGRPTSAKTVTASGSAAIDAATVDAAMHSTYEPATNDCKPVAGKYIFHVQTGPANH